MPSVSASSFNFFLRLAIARCRQLPQGRSVLSIRVSHSLFRFPLAHLLEAGDVQIAHHVYPEQGR